MHSNTGSHEADGSRIHVPKVAVEDLVRKRLRERSHIGMDGAKVASIDFETRREKIVGEDRLIGDNASKRDIAGPTDHQGVEVVGKANAFAAVGRAVEIDISIRRHREAINTRLSGRKLERLVGIDLLTASESEVESRIVAGDQSTAWCGCVGIGVEDTHMRGGYASPNSELGG